MRLFKQKPVTTSRRRPVSSGSSGPNRSFSYYHSSRTSRPPVSSGASHNIESTKARSSLGRRAVLSQFGRVLLGLFLLACLLSVLQINRTDPRVVVVNPKDDASLHDVSDYQSALANELQSSWVNTNKITVNTSALVSGLMARFPEVSDASVALPLISHRPTVYVELARPSLQLNTASQHLIVAANGQALVTSQADRPLKDFRLPVISDETSLSFQPGDVVLPSDDVAFIGTVLAQLSAQHVSVGKLVLPRASEEFDLYPAGTKYYVKFNLHNDNARQQVGTYLAVRQMLAQQHKTPKHYIDVRLDGRAYYK